jgi:predicted ATPase/signal transduction histidine kinase
MNNPTQNSNPQTTITIPNYQITETLYSGSRTIVYRAIRTDDQLPVVIKVMKRQYPSFSELVQFRNQYTIAKNLEIPGIIKPYSLEPYQNGYALIMEDFGGISLQEFSQRKPLKLEQFLTIAIQVADIIQKLHPSEVIHKDIKPANILINPETKQVKLTDFSIASLLPRETQEIQNPNILEGTLAYISPEQTGRMNRGIDYRSDFYSLGVTFYELLTGQLPFPSKDPMELIHCHLAKTPVLVNEINLQIPTIVSKIVQKMMAKNTEERYQSTWGLKHDLETCLTQLQETGKILDFEIGRRDVSDRFAIPDKLYGREAEVETLLQAFERASLGATEMILVAGFSGIGKTAVVNEVHKPIVRQRGYFIKGKFDQFNRNIPFSAFVQAFRDLMGQLVAESDFQIQQWKKQILEAVGDSGQVIIDVIPELENIIGKQPPAVELSGTTAQNRFNLLFQKFIHVFTTPEHPLVIFVDDLQWVDTASLKLMQLLMTDTRHLLLIGAYRDNEVNPGHPLMLTLSEIGKSQATINSINLTPLSQLQINQFVADSLKSTKKLALPLSKLVFQKTQGNPFFATQFLKALHQDGLIEFSLESGCWQCDITQVNQQALTDDVVEFMALQLQKLPEATQNILKLAACTGNQFDLETLAIVSQKSQTETATCLWKALQEGLILPISDVYKFYIDQSFDENRQDSQIVNYKFLHDRIQQAAYSLIPDDQKQTTHSKIGQLLLQQISPEAREDRIFEIVNQLNYGTALISEQKERDELAQLNLIACRKAKSSTAYQAAREYANTGLSLLSEKAWARQYEMSLALHELAAEVAMLNGDFEAMEQFIDIVTEQAHSLLEQVNVYRIRIQAKTSQRQLNEVLAIGINILQQLGITMTESPTPADIQKSIQEISELIGDREIADFVNLPVMKDANKIAIIQIASSIMSAAYTCGSLLYPLLASLLVKLFLQHGNISISATNYACYSVVLCNDKNIDLAAQFGKLALNVAGKFNDKASKLEVFFLLGSYILHRKSHLKEMLPLLSESYTLGLEVGNLEYAGYAVHNFCLISSWCGQPLAELEQDTRTYYNALVQLKQLGTANYCLIYWQVVLNLLGLAENPTIFSSSALQETEFLPMLRSANDMCGLYLFYSYKLTLCFLFGEVELANNNAFECRNYFMSGAGTVAEPAFYFYDSLIALALLSQASGEGEISTILERVAENQTKLQHWADYAPMNHQHKVDLVAAEKCRVLGQKSAAIELYDKSILGAKENEYIQEEALANELAAKFYLNWDKEKIAQVYMQEAYYCYTRWGAKAKVVDLEKRYPKLLAPILQQTRSTLSTHETIFSLGTVTSTSSHTSNSSVSVALDLATILKAYQALSSEIELEKLLSSLLSIVIENAGADKCVLMLMRDNHLLIRGSMTLGTEPVVLQHIRVENSQDLPLKLIYKVKHNLRTEALINASADSTLAHDPYIEQYQPKSVLCSPILHQGKLLGILYLENNLIAGAFTRDRVEILNLLCAQAAISLENAQLYERSQEYSQQLEQALLDLQNAQVQLVQSEKMSALGNLVSGVGHEMNNPLGFISATLQQAQPAVTDVIEYLNLYQETFPDKSSKLVEREEEIDLDYTLEDLPKMLGSMEMACDRLKNISTSLRTFSRADQEYKVPFNIHEGIDSTLLILKHRLKANPNRPEIEVITNYGNLPEVQCFPGQLNQVFMNILANAIDALDESNIGRSLAEIKANPNRITIQTSLENQSVKISIADNGKGMNEEVKHKIFEHLFTTKPVGKGTGLGLAIARQIVVEKHGGEIHVNSRLGEGTEFIINLPK